MLAFCMDVHKDIEVAVFVEGLLYVFLFLFCEGFPS